MGNVPWKISPSQANVNQMRALNTVERPCVEPSCGDPYVNGTKAVEAIHTNESRADPKYEHWCRPEPTNEFPWKNATQEQYREKQGGLQEDTDLPRNSAGAVKGSQVGVHQPKGAHFQDTGWGEYENLDQWNREQKGTYSGEKDEPFDRT